MERLIRLDGCLNFRDLGGYATRDGRSVRWRRVFRSDALHLLSNADVDHLRDALQLDGVIDLRSTAELEADGRGLAGAESFRFRHLPLFDGKTVSSEEAKAARSLADRYFLLAEFAKEAIGRVIEAVAESAGPVVYHCAAGKDRTGVISAVLLGILDVEEELVVADYVATQENLDAIVERLMESRGYRDVLSALPPETLHANQETMVAFLEQIRTHYGSMADYARSAGVREETVERLRGKLLEERSEGPRVQGSKG
jgi:protein-tyrosine phosphatase